MSPWLGFIVGPIAAAVVGLIIAIPVLRLKAAPYIIIATMCLAEIIRLVFTNLVDLTRGELGFWMMDSFHDIGSINFNGVDKIPYYYLMFIIFAVIALVCGILAKSSTGLAMKATGFTGSSRVIRSRSDKDKDQSIRIICLYGWILRSLLCTLYEDPYTYKCIWSVYDDRIYRNECVRRSCNCQRSDIWSIFHYDHHGELTGN